MASEYAQSTSEDFGVDGQGAAAAQGRPLVAAGCRGAIQQTFSVLESAPGSDTYLNLLSHNISVVQEFTLVLQTKFKMSVEFPSRGRRISPSLTSFTLVGEMMDSTPSLLRNIPCRGRITVHGCFLAAIC